MCGEKLNRIATVTTLLGSPPHVRGKAPILSVFYAQSGSPPHVRGKDVPTSLPPNQMKDHPRMCGEKDSQSENSNCLPGSPPHVRGKA